MSLLRLEADVHRRLRDLTVAFSHRISSTLSLEHALQAMAGDATRLFGARGTAIWLHDRRARELVLHASSDVELQAPAARVPAEGDTPPARGLRLERPALLTGDGSQRLLAPLRGWRRALGTLVLTGPFSTGLDSSQLTALAHELVRQLAPTIENIQLLEEVLHHRRLLEDTFNSIADPVVVIDRNLHIVQMNEAFVARVRTGRDDLIERHLDTLVGVELAAWVAHSARQRAEAGAETDRTRLFEDARLGGTFAVTMTPLVNETGATSGHVLVARDITHETRLEQERERLRGRLTQSEKLAALGQFVAGIAHEMNNPLQGVLGHLELLMHGTRTLPLRRDLRRIYVEAERAARIVRNLLAFTGATRLQRRRLSVPRILSKAITSRASALDRAGIEIVRTETAHLPMIAGDPLLLHQAFLNVLINAEHAIRSTGQGGRIEVHSSADASGTRVTTTVRDTGPGLAADVLPRIFDPFYTTKDVGQGTGLGLAITYGIMQDHGGSIHAANAAGGGAVLTLELPAASASS